MIILACAAVILSSTAILAKPRIEKGSLPYENISALAEKDSTVKCYKTIQAAPGKHVLYCGSCSELSGKAAPFSETGKCRR